MNDDWRVQVSCPTTGSADKLAEMLRDGGFGHDMLQGAGERVIVSIYDRNLFLYAGAREQAERAIDAVRAVARASAIDVVTDLRRWHPAAEEWVDADLPLPADDAALAAERAELLARERDEAAKLGYSEYEVRVHTRSHRETIELSSSLREQGISNLRRWRYLLIGAADEDSARALAERIAALAPPGSAVTAEASLAEVASEVGPNPFTVFGGLGV